MKNINRAVFLDRDGVINRVIIKHKKPYAPLELNKLKILAGVKKAIKELRKSGWLIIVITNQPDVARGKAKFINIELINRYLKKHLSINKFYTCYHDSVDQCDCRKPLTGSFSRAQKKYKISFKKSFMIGDRWSDIEAGKKIGCKTIFIDYKYTEKQPKNFDYKVKSLSQAAKIILKIK